MGRKGPAIAGNGPNDAVVSFGPLVCFFFKFSSLFLYSNYCFQILYVFLGLGWVENGRRLREMAQTTQSSSMLFFYFLRLFSILTKVSRLYLYNEGSEGLKTAGDCGIWPKRRSRVIWASSMFFIYFLRLFSILTIVLRFYMYFKGWDG